MGCGKSFKGMGYLNEHFDEDHVPTVISFNLSKLIAQQETIPISKVKAKIKELESDEDYGAMMCRCGCSDENVLVVKTLKELLPKEDD